jgi:hypothetical protein
MISSPQVNRCPVICPDGGMVDTLVLGTSVERCVGSSPTLGTKNIWDVIP